MSGVRVNVGCSGLGVGCSGLGVGVNLRVKGWNFGLVLALGVRVNARC